MAITKKQHKTLQTIFDNYPNLSLQNRGYEEIDLSTLSEEEKEKFKEVETILKDEILGFVRFQNFRKHPTGKCQLRFQYDYTAGDTDRTFSFIGVGYLLLEQLLN